jgi:hypothetical protein
MEEESGRHPLAYEELVEEAISVGWIDSRVTGRRAVEATEANGWWTIHDAVEDLLETTTTTSPLPSTRLSPSAPH